MIKLFYVTTIKHSNYLLKYKLQKSYEFYPKDLIAKSKMALVAENGLNSQLFFILF
jgi:hypothetical protein